MGYGPRGEKGFGQARIYSVTVQFMKMASLLCNRWLTRASRWKLKKRFTAQFQKCCIGNGGRRWYLTGHIRVCAHEGGEMGQRWQI